MEFRHRLKQLRVDAGLTLQAVADRVGRNRATVFRWENGEREPDLSDLEAWGRALGVEIDVTIRQPRDGGEVVLSVVQDSAHQRLGTLIADIADDDVPLLMSLAERLAGIE